MSALQARILACARDVYLEEGLPGLSMRHLADRLGVTATAIYRHYRNKEDLIHRVIEEAMKAFGAGLATSLSGRSPEDRFERGGEAYLEFALRQPKYYEILFMSPRHFGSDGMPEDLQRMGQANFQFLVDRVQDCMDAGRFRKDDPREVATLFWSHSHGLLSLFLAGKLGQDEAAFRALYRANTRRLLRSFLV